MARTKRVAPRDKELNQPAKPGELLCLASIQKFRLTGVQFRKWPWEDPRIQQTRRNVSRCDEIAFWDEAPKNSMSENIIVPSKRPIQSPRNEETEQNV